MHLVSAKMRPTGQIYGMCSDESVDRYEWDNGSCWIHNKKLHNADQRLNLQCRSYLCSGDSDLHSSALSQVQIGWVGSRWDRQLRRWRPHRTTLALNKFTTHVSIHCVEKVRFERKRNTEKTLVPSPRDTPAEAVVHNELDFNSCNDQRKRSWTAFTLLYNRNVLHFEHFVKML